MRFLMFYTPAPSAHPAPPAKEDMEAMNKLIEAAMKSGEMIATGGLTPIKQGARAASASGKVTVRDGPFIESTELSAALLCFSFPRSRLLSSRQEISWRSPAMAW